LSASLEIEIDAERCSGSGECSFRAPATFRLGDANKAEVADPAGEPEETILEAARSCPCFAITVRRAGTPVG
jgi:ferredoxin